MTQETLREANNYNSKITAFKHFKEDLAKYMRDDIQLTEMDQKYGFFYRISQKIWWRLLSMFAPLGRERHYAPDLTPDQNISDPDAKALYDDLCAVADKWIDIYQKRLEEL